MIMILKKTDHHFRTKEVSNELVDKRKDKITALSKQIDFNNLKYHYKGNNVTQKFDNFDNAFVLFDKIKNGKITLEYAKKE